MGGHGALTLYLKYPNLYKSVSAFAPIANPSNCPWGEKAFSGYFGYVPLSLQEKLTWSSDLTKRRGRLMMLRS